ncbi:MAG: 30S ribosomal protein S6 [Candidatus Eremiobacteraeota bacterium]|nr:30S ribosomal protein S6 [Candidatus Eremiobacteraeota bacterium]
MNAYEVTYIIDSALTEENVQKTIEKFSDHVSKAGGQVVNVDNWGKRRLAYEIKGKLEGVYVTMRYNAPENVSSELRRIMGIDEEIVRNIIIRVN